MNRKLDAGFTIVELMMVIAIIGILAIVAIPNYHGYVKRAERSNAIKDLDRIMSAQERYYADKSKYAEFLTDLGYDSKILKTDYYNITLSKCTLTKTDASGNKTTTDISLTQCIRVSATPIGSQKGDGELVYESSGLKQRIVNGGAISW